MPRTTERDRATRERWALFLEEVLSQVTIARLDKQLANLPRRSSGADNRNALYAYRNRIRTVTPGVAFDCGEAIRATGASQLAWCNGPLALWAAGFLSAFVRVISSSSAQLGEHTDAAIKLAALTPLAVKASARPATPAVREAARVLLEDLRGEQFLQAYKSDSRRGLDDYLPVIERLASSSTPLTYLEPAVVGALQEWALWRASPETRAELIEPIARARLEAEKARLADIASRSAQSAAIVDRIMATVAAVSGTEETK